MLNGEKLPRFGYLIGIVGLLCIIAFLGYKIGVYEGDIRTANIIKGYTEAENAELEEMFEQYIQAIKYYQNLLSRALVIEKDRTMFLKKDTLIIPPIPKVEEENVNRVI